MGIVTSPISSLDVDQRLHCQTRFFNFLDCLFKICFIRLINDNSFGLIVYERRMAIIIFNENSRANFFPSAATGKQV